MTEQMPALTTEEAALVANLTRYEHPSMASLLQSYHWLCARLALAQYISEEAIKQGTQLTLAGVGRDSTPIVDTEGVQYGPIGIKNPSWDKFLGIGEGKGDDA